MSGQNATKRIITYLLITFALSGIFYVLIIQNGGIGGGGTLYVFPLMWSPGIAGLITNLIFQRNFRNMGWKFGKLKYHLIAYLLPIIYASVVYIIIWSTGLGEFDPTGLGDNWVMGIIQVLTLGVLGAAITALGEEIGWRGLLVPQLAKTTSFTRTALTSGVIWGLWHIPLILWGGYSSDTPTWFAISCFAVEIIGMSFAYAWIRLASGSIWPAVLMHSVHNAFIQSALDRLTVPTSNVHYFTTEFGLGLALMGVVIGLIFWQLGKKLDLAQAQ